MKLCVKKAVAIAGLAFLANQSFAGCATMAILGAPKIPKIEDSRMSQMPELASEMRAYVEAAQARLDECYAYSDSFEYNAAVSILEEKADRFNELARFYNRNYVAAQ